jgi:hypothetical protein
MEEYDKPRAKRVVGEWVDATKVMIEDQTDDPDYTTVEDMLTDLAESHADLRAMQGLHQELERDCE